MPQSYTALHYHFVFSTKNRETTITTDIQPHLYKYIGGIIREEKGSLLAIGGTADHIHLLVRLSQQHCVADVMRVLKTNSSKWIHETFAEANSFTWQAGYGAFSVSASNRERVTRYINNQEKHHRKM